MYDSKFQHSQMKACVTAKVQNNPKEPQIKHQTICLCGGTEICQLGHSCGKAGLLDEICNHLKR